MNKEQKEKLAHELTMTILKANTEKFLTCSVDGANIEQVAVRYKEFCDRIYKKLDSIYE